jgi:hypothetical protein
MNSSPPSTTVSEQTLLCSVPWHHGKWHAPLQYGCDMVPSNVQMRNVDPVLSDDTMYAVLPTFRFEDGDGKHLRNVGNTNCIYTAPRNSIHIGTKPP